MYFSNYTWAQCIFPPSLHHNVPDLARLAAHFWPTSHRLVVYFPDARPLIRPYVLSLPIIIVWNVYRLVEDMTVGSSLSAVPLVPNRLIDLTQNFTRGSDLFWPHRSRLQYIPGFTCSVNHVRIP